jgi:DNA-binding NarL/FixJ family response regulator
VELRGTATNAADALALARCVHPDVVLVDLRLGREDGADLAARLRDLLPACAVIVCSTLSREDLPAHVSADKHLHKEQLTVAVLSELAGLAA